MQQTDKYQLNLIEPSDSFLPDGLNENTQKLEDVLFNTLSAQDTKVNSWMAEVAKQVGRGGKTARIAWGSYVGDNTCGEDHPTRHMFDFCPVLIIVGSESEFMRKEGRPSVFIRPLAKVYMPSLGQAITTNVHWTENGVWYYTGNSNHQNNYSMTYYYFAIGYDKNS